jgi:hypothetical protein
LLCMQYRSTPKFSDCGLLQAIEYYQ